MAFDQNFSLDGSEANIAMDGYDRDSGLSFMLDSGMTYERETRIINQSEPRPTGESLVWQHHIHDVQAKKS